jgi:protoporphyrinogen oxidase
MSATHEGMEPKIVIVGAGPCGLGAAWRLTERGHGRWTLLESSPVPGGLAASVVDPQGFTWDLGGHVLFSHYDYFDALMDLLLGDAWVYHVREAWVRMRGRFIPYPMQNNIWQLPADDLVACLDGLIDVLDSRDAGDPAWTFEQWIRHRFGEGLARVFLVPYNTKVWAYPPSALSSTWVGERVATVDLKRILRNWARQHQDVSWGPNNRFRFPLTGGTGAIWSALWRRLPEDKRRLNCPVTAVDPSRREVRTADDATLQYDYLVSTMPLDSLLRLIGDASPVAPSAGRLMYSSTHLVGLGVRGTIPDELSQKCWMYFPEPEVPFYRATVFSNYSPNNVPDPQRFWSLMCEVSESPVRPVAADRLVDEVLSACRSEGLLPPGAEIASIWTTRLEHGYPTPFVGRDAVVDEADAWLESIGIFSRGRFGAWKYEVSNQDHALMQGVEIVDRLLDGSPELTVRHPSIVNGPRQGRPAGPVAHRSSPP